MRTTIFLPILLAAAALPGNAAATPGRSVARYLADFTAVRQGGMLAMFGAEAKALLTEANAALNAWEAQVPSARPRLCPPEAAADMKPDEFLALLSQVPAADRGRTSVKSAVIALLNRRHLCRKP